MSDEAKPNCTCLIPILQAINAGFSAISTMLVVNVFGSNDPAARAYSIIMCAIIVFAISVFKFIKKALPKGNGTIEFAKGASDIAIGFSDAMFDMFAAVALLQPGSIVDMEVTMVVIGTFTGLSEELLSLLFDLMFKVSGNCGAVCAFHSFLIQIFVAMIQPAAMATAIEDIMGEAVETDPPPVLWGFCFADFVVLLGTAVLLKLEENGETYNMDRIAKSCSNRNTAA